MSNIINATINDFKEAVLDSKMPVLVDFWAPWCGPCIMMGPVLEELSGDFDGKLKVVKVNVNEPENMPLAEKYDIRGIPNMKLFKGGAVAKELVGMMPKHMLVEELNVFLK